MTRAGFLLAAILLVLVPPASVAGDPAVPRATAGPRELARIRVVDLTHVHDYVVSVESTSLELAATRHVAVTREARLQALLGVGRPQDRKRRERRLAADRVPHDSGRKAEWADFSADATYALVGYENPIGHPLRTAAVVEVSGRSKPWNLRLQGYVEDSLWTGDPSTVLVLEATERWLKSPRGLLRLLLGHPVPLSNVYLTACSLESRTCERIEIARDLEFATMCLERADSGPGCSAP